MGGLRVCWYADAVFLLGFGCNRNDIQNAKLACSTLGNSRRLELIAKELRTDSATNQAKSSKLLTSAVVSMLRLSHRWAYDRQTNPSASQSGLASVQHVRFNCTSGAIQSTVLDTLFTVLETLVRSCMQSALSNTGAATDSAAISKTRQYKDLSNINIF